MTERVKRKPIPRSVALASYQDVSYVRHGLEQMEILKSMVDSAKADLIAEGMQNMDFAIAYKAMAETESALNNMLVAHRQMSKIMRQNGYEKIIPEKHWVDDNGEPLGFSPR